MPQYRSGLGTPSGGRRATGVNAPGLCHFVRFTGFVALAQSMVCYTLQASLQPADDAENEMRLKTFIRSPLALPLAFALSMATWLATAVSHRAPHREDDGMVWVYVWALCAPGGDTRDCRPTGQARLRVFDSREACAAQMDADLSHPGPRSMGSCQREREA